MNSTVRFRIDADAGQIWIDEGTLFLGELTDIEIVGYAPREGRVLRLTVFDSDGKTPLADNSADPSKLDLRMDVLRQRFGVDRKVMVFKAFLVEIGGEGYQSADTLGSGMVAVRWTPFVSEAGGSIATLRGRRGPVGKKGDKGDKGNDAILKYVQDPDTKLYHEIVAKKNILGQNVLVVSGQGVEKPDNDWASREELKGLATKEEIGNLASKEDIEGLATKDDISGLASKEDIELLASKEELGVLSSECVKTTGDQTVAGDKTFTGDMKGASLARSCMPDVVNSYDIDINNTDEHNFIKLHPSQFASLYSGWLFVYFRSADVNDTISVVVYKKNANSYAEVYRRRLYIPVADRDVDLFVPIPAGCYARLNNSVGMTLNTCKFFVNCAE